MMMMMKRTEKVASTEWRRITGGIMNTEMTGRFLFANSYKMSCQSYIFLVALALFSIYSHTRLGMLQIIVTTDEIEVRRSTNQNYNSVGANMDNVFTNGGENRTLRQNQIITTSGGDPLAPQQNQNQRKYSKVFMGIFTSDLGKHEMRYRNAFRELLQKNHPQVCSIHNYTNNIKIRNDCELIYTFVLGGANDKNTNVTEMVNNYTYPKRPLVLPTYNVKPARFATDFWKDDMTFLNIK
jgi:hypothetical protein